MTKRPTKSTKRTKPAEDGKNSTPLIRDRHHGDDRIVEFFAQRQEAEWPKPSPVDVAQIAANLGNAPQAPEEAVKLIWRCAVAQEDQIAAVREFRARKAQQKMDFELGEAMVSHEQFLSDLNLEPIRVRPGVRLRKDDLWMEFLRQLPVTSLYRDLLRPSGGDRSFTKSANGQTAEDWEAERKREGWGDAEIRLWFTNKFADWRQKTISENMRTAALSGKRGLKRAREAKGS